MTSNREIADALEDLAALTVLDEGSPQAFRVRAYETAARTVAGWPVPVADLSAAELRELRGVGPATAAKIREFVETGAIARLDELRRRFPVPFRDLTRVPGIGPKRALQLREQLGVEDVDGLRRALELRRLRTVPGFGAISEENVARALERLGMGGKERRTPIGEAMRSADRVVEALRGLPGVDRAEVMGSIRRFRETIGDVDVVVASDGDPAGIMERFVTLPLVAEVVGHGARKSAVLTHEGLQIDLRVVRPDQFGSAALYFTGSKAHNIALRQRAISGGRTLSEYGLADAETGEVVASATEEDVYRALGMDWVPPELREDRGEVQLAAEGRLPRLVEEGQLRGDLHVHTSLSGDGRDPLEAMVAAAAARGYEYVAITDHGEDLAINGASREQLTGQGDEIARLRVAYPGMRILHGCELNIGVDGSVDYDPEFLARLDWGVAGVHHAFGLDEARQTRRIVAAMENPAVNAIGHLTGRKIGSRPGIEVDLEQVFAAAERTGTALEINCHLDRLDLGAEMLRSARERGVLFVISTDAHDALELANTRWGVRTAARGWVEPDRVVNTWPAGRFLAWAEAKRRE